MARNRRPKVGVKPVYTFALSWLFLSAFMPMFRPATFLLSLGMCGMISYFMGRKSGKQAQQQEEEARRRAQVEAAQVKPQYTSQRAGQQTGPQYTSQRVQQQAAPQRKSYGPEIDPILEEGNKALSEMGRLYMSIKDPNVRQKINELMRVTDKITQDAIADPSDIPQIKKFMNYYLPTTIKLLNAYDRMSAQGIEGENLDKTMKSIDAMLDDAIVAYKKMLDSLFANQALDIETDIAVMNTMLAREGLAGVKDFDLRPAAAPAPAAPKPQAATFPPAAPETPKPQAATFPPAAPEAPKPQAATFPPAAPETPKPQAATFPPAAPETSKPRPSTTFPPAAPAAPQPEPAAAEEAPAEDKGDDKFSVAVGDTGITLHF